LTVWPRGRFYDDHYGLICAQLFTYVVLLRLGRDALRHLSFAWWFWTSMN